MCDLGKPKFFESSEKDVEVSWWLNSVIHLSDQVWKAKSVLEGRNKGLCRMGAKSEAPWRPRPFFPNLNPDSEGVIFHWVWGKFGGSQRELGADQGMKRKFRECKFHIHPCRALFIRGVGNPI